MANSIIPIPNSIWYQQGIQAKKDGLKKTDCPFKPFTFGEVEWLRGFNEPAQNP